jgi:predicted amidohydrolase YtcJ
MGDDGRSGLLRITQPELDELVDRYDGAGIRMSIHAMGDVALDMALEAFGRRAQGGSLHPMRHRIEHMGNWLCSTSRLTEARRLGIVPVPNPSMQYHLPDEIRADLGEARAATAFQFQSLVDAGLPLVFGSDGPGYWPIDPLRDIGVAASRSTRTGTAVGEATTVAVRSALIAQTRTSAWLGFREADLGSLAPGKRADLAVLAADPATVTPEEIGRIAVDMTVVEGRIAFERGG